MSDLGPSWPSCLAHLSRRLLGEPTISNNFSSEITRPIITKFYIEPPEIEGKKNCSNDVGHMSNMAAMPIYGKNLKKSSSPGPIDQ